MAGIHGSCYLSAELGQSTKETGEARLGTLGHSCAWAVDPSVTGHWGSHVHRGEIIRLSHRDGLKVRGGGEERESRLEMMAQLVASSPARRWQCSH